MKFRNLVLLTLVLTLVLSACAPKPDVSVEEADVEEAAVVEEEAAVVEEEAVPLKICQVVSEGGVNDKSFNQMGWEGTLRAVEDFGVKAQYLVTKQSSDYAANVAACVTEGSDLIISTGFRAAPATLESAEGNPDQKYAIIDSSSTGIPNVLGNETAMDQTTFLAGYLSAAMTKTGRVGTYVGQLFPATQAFVDGYYMGVMYYNEVKGTNVELVGYDPAKKEEVAQIGNFQDQDAGKNLTLSFLDEGIDIILPVAGSVSIGTASALVERDNGCMIGVDRELGNFESGICRLHLG